MNRSDDATVAFLISRETHTRARRAARRLCCTLSAFSRGALIEKLDEYEARFEREDEELTSGRLDRQIKFRNRRKTVDLRVGLERAEGPDATEDDIGDADPGVEKKEPSPSAPIDERLDDVCLPLAEKILKYGTNETSTRNLARTAVTAVKKQMPLTHPGDAVILCALERAVMKLVAKEEAERKRSAVMAAPAPTRTESPEARAFDSLVGKVINGNIKTRGDVP